MARTRAFLGLPWLCYRCSTAYWCSTASRPNVRARSVQPGLWRSRLYQLPGRYLLHRRQQNRGQGECRKSRAAARARQAAAPALAQPPVPSVPHRHGLHVRPKNGTVLPRCLPALCAPARLLPRGRVWLHSAPPMQRTDAAAPGQPGALSATMLQESDQRRRPPCLHPLNAHGLGPQPACKPCPTGFKTASAGSPSAANCSGECRLLDRRRSLRVRAQRRPWSQSDGRLDAPARSVCPGLRRPQLHRLQPALVFCWWQPHPAPGREGPAPQRSLADLYMLPAACALRTRLAQGPAHPASPLLNDVPHPTLPRAPPSLSPSACGAPMGS